MNFSELLRIGTYTILLCVAQFSFFSIETDGRSLQVESVTSRSESFRNTQPLIKLNKGNAPPTISVDASRYKNQIGNPQIYPPIVISDEVQSTNLQVVDGGLKSETTTQSGINRGYLIRIHEWASVQVDENTSTVFEVSLRAKPSGDVQITISPFSTAGLSHTQTTPLTFSPSNYDQPQTVTVTAAADDGNTVHEQESITLSASGAEYEGISKSLPVQVFDDDVSGFKIMTNPDRSMEVTETVNGNDTGKFEVWLSDSPSSPVTVTMLGFDNTDVTITGQSRLQFTPGNYSKPKTFNIKVREDNDSNDEFAHTILTASGGEYNGVSQPYRVLITDGYHGGEIRWDTSCDYCAHEEVKEGESLPLTFYFESIEAVPPDGVEISFNWRTTPIPNKPRFLGGPTLTWNCSLPTESVEITPDPIKLNFTRFNYTGESITIKAKKDNNADDEYLCLEITSDPELPRYRQPLIDNLYILIDDKDDVDGDIDVSFVRGTCDNQQYNRNNREPTDPFKIKEDCTEDLVLGVSLTNDPNGEVRVEVPQFENKDLRVKDRRVLTFKGADNPQRLRIEVIKDDTADSEEGSITLVAKGGGYDGKTNTITVEIEDVDMPDLMAPEEVRVQEGDSAFLEVTLGSEPTDKLQMSITGHAGSDLTVTPETVKFTPTATNKLFHLPKVTLTAGEDDDSEIDVVTLTLKIRGSDYDGSTADVDVIIEDTTVPPEPVIMLEPSNLEITEGESASFDVNLSIQPPDSVSVTIPSFKNPSLTHDRESEKLDFTAGDYNQRQTVTITAKEDDNFVDETETITLKANEAPYEGVTETLTVSVIDNDVDGGIQAVPYLKIDEGESSKHLMVALTAMPLNDVTVTIEGHSKTDLSLSEKQLTFAEGNYDVGQTINLSAEKEVGLGEDYEDDIVNLKFIASGGGYDTTHVTKVTIVDNDVKSKVTLKLSPDSISEKGDSTTVTATLAPPSSHETTVTISATPGPLATRNDYKLSDNTKLTFDAGQTESAGTVTITAKDNDIFGPPEKQIRVSGKVPDHVIAPDDVTLTIRDDEDKPKVTLILSSKSIPEKGGSTTVTATLDRPSSQRTTVTISATPDDPPAKGGDFTLTGTTLTIPAGETTSIGTVTITAINNDDLGPLQKTITVSGTVPAHVIAPDDVTLTITDDEKAPRSLPTTVTLSADPESVVEGKTTTLTATLSEFATTDVPINLVYEDITTEPGDYSTPPSLIIPAGELTGSGQLTTLNDEIVEPDEKFRVRIKKPEGIDLGYPSEVVITIEDDGDTAPPVEVLLTVDPPRVKEGKEVTVTVTLQGKTLGVDVPIPLTYPPDGATAEADKDYTPVYELTIMAGEKSKSGTIQTRPDSDEEGEETFTVAFGPLPPEVSGGRLLSKEVTIVDAPQQPPEVSLSVDERQIDEGEQVTVTLKISSPLDDDVTIPLTLTGGTTTSEDYRLSGSTDLVIPGGKDEAELMIEALNDSLLEEDETFKIALGDVPNDVVQGMPSEIEMTIIDTDVPIIDARPSVQIREGEQETITVALGAIPPGAVSIAVTGQSGTDLSVAPSSWVFSSRTQEVTLTAGEDDDVTSDNIKLLLTADGGAYSGVNHEIQVTINDDDRPGLMVVPNPISMDEGESKSMEVRLTKQPSAEVKIAMIVGGARLRLISPPELTFTTLNWDSNQFVEIMAEKDDDAEKNEPVQVILSALSGGYAGISKTVMVTILEKDEKGLNVDRPSISIKEGSSDEVRVSLKSQPVRGEVTVGISGHEGSDVSLQPSSLTFGPTDWKIPKPLMIRAETDSDLDDDPPVRLILWARGGNYDGQQAEVEVTILEQGIPEISIYGGRASETEGEIGLRVELSHPTDQVVRVFYETKQQTGDQAAEAGNDFTASRGIVIFDPRATRGVIEIDIKEDGMAEKAETFTVSLFDPKHARIARGVATATILDSDGGIPTVTIEDAVAHQDARVITFQIHVSQPSSQSVSVRYRTADGTATAGRDYMQRSGLATITPGSVQTTIEVPLLNTEAKQQRETFYVHLESSETVQVGKSVATAVIEQETEHAREALTAFAARFVRTVSVQLVEAVQERLHPSGSICSAAQRAEMVQRWQWTPSLGELLSGCQISETSGTFGVWGRGAFRRFHGRGDLNQALRGDVSSAIIGADVRSERGWLAGVMVAYSQAAGTYSDVDVETGLTGVYPYASYEASRWEFWMSGGYGWGHAETHMLEEDLTSRFGAVGFKAQLASAGSTQLNYYGDAIVTDVEVDHADVRAEVIRVRLGIESSFELRQGIRPYVEANVRQDGGDAETGIGLEFGGGLRVAYPQWKLRGEVRSQGLVLHSADGFTEWGVSGSIQVGNPSEGWMMRVRPSYGPNHRMTLYRQQTILDVAPYRSGMHRTEVELGYGMPVYRGSVRSIVGVTELPSGRLFRLGGQLSPWKWMSLSISGLAHHHQANIGDMSVNVQASLRH